MMPSQRRGSYLKIGAVGLGVFTGSLFSVLAFFLGVMLYFPFPWAKAIVGQAQFLTMDAMRGMTTGWTIYPEILLMAGLLAGVTLGLTALGARRFHVRKKDMVYLFSLVFLLALFALPAFMGPITAASATQKSEYNQYNEKGFTYLVFICSNGATTYYCAQNGDTGKIDYGGSGNAGSAV